MITNKDVNKAAGKHTNVHTEDPDMDRPVALCIKHPDGTIADVLEVVVGPHPKTGEVVCMLIEKG